MIITSILKLIPGKVYSEKDLRIPFEYNGEFHKKYAFLVVREATLEEFRDEIKKEYKEKAHEVINMEYFYEISMD